MQGEDLADAMAKAAQEASASKQSLRPQGMTAPKGPGLKFDEGKARWDLVPTEAVEAIAQVLAFGAAKYSENNWQNVSPFGPRYYAATMRHLAAWHRGEKIDPESGLSHLSHAGCCLLFLLWREQQDLDSANTDSGSHRSPPRQSEPEWPDPDPSARPSDLPPPDMSGNPRRGSSAWTLRPLPTTGPDTGSTQDAPENSEGRHLID